MIGLIKKDILVLKSNFKILIPIFVIYIFMAFQGMLDISTLLSFLSVMLMMSTFSYDNLNKWDAYAVTLPNGRKNLVKAKYLATVIVILLTSLVATIVSFIITINKGENINYQYIFITLGATIFATFLFQALMYPIIFKFGLEKARLILFILIFGLIFLGGFLINKIDFSFLASVIDYFSNFIVLILLGLGLLVLLGSYIVSVNIYLKKEF